MDDSAHRDAEGNPAPPGHREADEIRWLSRLPRMLDDYWQARSSDQPTSRLTYSEAKQPFLDMAGLADAQIATTRNMREPIDNLEAALDRVIKGLEDNDESVEAQPALWAAALDIAIRWSSRPGYVEAQKRILLGE